MSTMPGPRNLVINTGPLLALAAVGRLGVLKELFARIVVPSEVCQEIAAGGRTQFAREEFAAATWFDRRGFPTVLPPFLRATLDPGEAAVIATALAENIATVCIDEALGRRYARLHGLAVTGSVGVLIRAKELGLPVNIRSSIAQMRQRGIWLGPALEAEAIRRARE
jgi:predicted nucleic acid-binding protein